MHKTINAEFIQTHALSQLSFVQFRPYATLFLELLLSLILILKSKKILETSLDLTPYFNTSVDARVEGVALNVDSSENRHHNFIQKKYNKEMSAEHKRFILWTVIFLFVQTFYTVNDYKR